LLKSEYLRERSGNAAEPLKLLLMTTMLERIEQRLSNVADTAREATEHAVGVVEHTQDEVDQTLKNSPLMTLGFALLVGFALGALYRL
jgi:ElaB/YqjD/DUF883 family membrane-anchored ribosome-binding protein